MDQNRKALQVSEIGSNIKNKNEIFAEFWARLCAAYPRTELTRATTQIYFEKLQRFSPEQLKRASDIIIENCEYFPTIAEVIDTIRRLSKSQPNILSLDEPRHDPKVGEMLSDLVKKFDARRAK